MPIFCRCRLMSVFLSVMTAPPNSVSFRKVGSPRNQERRNVDFPDGRPDDHDDLAARGYPS